MRRPCDIAKLKLRLAELENGQPSPLIPPDYLADHGHMPAEAPVPSSVSAEPDMYYPSALIPIGGAKRLAQLRHDTQITLLSAGEITLSAGQGDRRHIG